MPSWVPLRHTDSSQRAQAALVLSACPGATAECAVISRAPVPAGTPGLEPRGAPLKLKPSSSLDLGVSPSPVSAAPVTLSPGSSVCKMKVLAPGSPRSLPGLPGRMYIVLAPKGRLRQRDI